MEQRLTELDARVGALRDRLVRLGAPTIAQFHERLDISWIYHENALEGVVLSYSEIKAAIDKKIISDVSLIPMYQEIKNQKAAIEYMRDLCARRKATFTLDVVRKIYGLLTPEEAPKSVPYRRDNPLHRLYYHEIAQPDKIPARMKKVVDWMGEEDARRLHPIERAARFHFQFMGIYPWTKNVGRAGRLIMNFLLLREGYPPAIIHAIERQRYYEALRGEHAGLLPLIVESVSGTVEAAARILGDFVGETRRSRAAS
jgi:Fic family protein